MARRHRRNVVAGIRLASRPQRGLGIPWQQDQDRRGSRQAHRADDANRTAPRDNRHEPCGRGRYCHLSQIAGEIVGAEGAAGSLRLVGRRNQRRADRMLRRGARTADQQHDDQQKEPSAGKADRDIGAAGQRGADCQHQRAAPADRQPGRRHLQSRHGAGKQHSQDAQSREAQPELGLPNRQQYIDEIGEAVVQRVYSTGHGKSAPAVILSTAQHGANRCRCSHFHPPHPTRESGASRGKNGRRRMIIFV